MLKQTSQLFTGLERIDRRFKPTQAGFRAEASACHTFLQCGVLLFHILEFFKKKMIWINTEGWGEELTPKINKKSGMKEVLKEIWYRNNHDHSLSHDSDPQKNSLGGKGWGQKICRRSKTFFFLHSSWRVKLKCSIFINPNWERYIFRKLSEGGAHL